MKLSIENFGPIKKRIEIEPRPLTIFCGANNTGKTYALYVLHALQDQRFVAQFDKTRQLAHDLYELRNVEFSAEDWLSEKAIGQAEKNIAESLKKTLPRFFVSQEDLAKDATFGITLDVQKIRQGITPRRKGAVVTGKSIAFDRAMLRCEFDESGVWRLSLDGEWPRPAVTQALNELLMDFYCPSRKGRDFLLPAERTGINLFFRELNAKRAALLRHATSATLDTSELLKDIVVSRYPQPIQDYIEFMGLQPEIKRKSSEYADLAAHLQKQVLRVKYKIDRYGDISIAPARSGTEVGLHLGSSTVKTFFGLWSYLNHLAQPGDWLMIDEPELNLHPKNQLEIALLLAQLSNRGLNVVVSTHSDYMVRQWGNLLMLSANFSGRDELAKKHGLPENAWLLTEGVCAYEFDQGGAAPMSISAQEGIRTELFDQSILSLNTAAQSIYFARQEDEEL